MKKVYKIDGMHCESCAKMIELDLEDAGINAVCDLGKEELTISDPHDKKQISEIVKNAGYKLIS